METKLKKGGELQDAILLTQWAQITSPLVHAMTWKTTAGPHVPDSKGKLADMLASVGLSICSPVICSSKNFKKEYFRDIKQMSRLEPGKNQPSDSSIDDWHNYQSVTRFLPKLILETLKATTVS